MAGAKSKSGFIDWSFLGREVGKGALQAVGSIVVYAIILSIILSKFFKNSDRLKQALVMKAPGLVYTSDRVSGSS